MEEASTTTVPVSPAPQINTPVISAVSASDYEDQQRKAADDAKAAELAKDKASELLSYMNKCLNEAVQARQLNGITDRLLDAQRRRRGEHSAEKQAQLKKYNLPNYWVPLTQTKCIHTEAWLRDLLMPYADKIWRLMPTDDIELDADEENQILHSVMQEAANYIQGGGMVSDQQIHDVKMKIREQVKKAKLEEAKEKAQNMEDLIFDQHEECGFRNVFREFQSNLTTYGTAFIRGPFTVVKKMPKWQKDQRVVEDKVIPSCSAPSPHDIYPAPWAKDEQDGYILERIKTYREGLSTLKDLKYYQKTEIEAFLSESQASATSSIQYGDTERYMQEDKTLNPIDNRLEVWLFNGPIPGFMLNDWGFPDFEASLDYKVEVLWTRNHILKVMPLWDETGVRSYFKAVFKLTPGSFWGVGVPHLMMASQDRANAMMIALLDNATWATGTIAWIDQSRLINVNDAKDFHSKKLIPVYSGPGQNGAPMGVIEFPMHVPELSSLYEKCLSDADNESGVPAYMYGSGGGGPAAGTYSGLTTLMNSSAKGIKDATLEIDQCLTRFIQHWADWNMEYVDDDDIKGDIRVVCSGSTGLFVLELQLDKLDHLIAQAAPFIPITGPGFVLSMLRQKAKALKVDISDLPTDEEIAAIKQAQSQPQPTPIKPSLNIACKWETLTPDEKAQIMPQIGVQETPSTPPSNTSGNVPVPNTGTPANLPGTILPNGSENSNQTRVTPVPPIRGQA